MGCDDYGDTVSGTGAPGYMRSALVSIPAYAQLPLCIDPGTHYFQLDTIKWDTAVCTRCGLIRKS
jgi:hypothetical protein